MISKIYSAVIQGMAVRRAEVEVDVEKKKSESFFIVGATSTVTREEKVKIEGAVKNSGIDFIKREIRINITPTKVRIPYHQFDIPFLVGILHASGQIASTNRWLEETMFIGELGLDGSLKKGERIFPLACDALSLGFKRIIMPAQNAKECSIVDGITIIGIKDINELLKYLKDPDKVISTKFKAIPQTSKKLDYSDIKGHTQAKRAMQICAAGGHNILLYGSPGSGKSMLAKRLPSIMDQMSHQEAIEVMRIYSMQASASGYAYSLQRPFRSPHHTVSVVGLLGGGVGWVKPGEISLAHKGILFLDELTEFKTHTLECLRQPLEDKHVNIVRTHSSVKIPADFMLVAAMNPCPCGYLGCSKRRCVCTANDVKTYLDKLSGPFLDRIDLQLHIETVGFDQMHDTQPISSEDLNKDIKKALAIQKERSGKLNNNLDIKDIEQYCTLSDESNALMKAFFETFKLSTRSYHKVLMISRTIADLEGSKDIQQEHIQEAISFRGFDRFLERWK